MQTPLQQGRQNPLCKNSSQMVFGTQKSLQRSSSCFTFKVISKTLSTMPEQSSDELWFFSKSDFPMVMSSSKVRITSNCSLLERSENLPPLFPGENAGRKHLLARWHGNALGGTELYNPGKNILWKMQKWPEFLSRVDWCSYMRVTEKHLKLNTDLVHCVSTVQRHGAQEIKHEK